ncbi:MAG TPA: site-specific integrase, partial [Patescibacteria group bacterium]|nr:site-specific integrase [Patescibacteria group bacterium]
MSTALPDLIDQFLEYLEIEKNSSKLTIRDYRHYLETFLNWHSATLPEQPIEKLNLDNIRKYRVFLSNKTDDHGQNLKKVTQNYYVIALRSFLRYLI